MKGKAKLGIKGSDMVQAWDEAIFILMTGSFGS
jgi:hypothetical protein